MSWVGIVIALRVARELRAERIQRGIAVMSVLRTI
jgi:hypothetical protein